MRGKLFLVQWDSDKANERAGALRSGGWKVDVECENGGRAYRLIRTSVPDVVVLDLERRPSRGRAVGNALRGLRATRAVPIVCIEQSDQAREETRLEIPDAIFTSPGDLLGALADAEERVRAERSPPPSSRRRRAASAI